MSCNITLASMRKKKSADAWILDQLMKSKYFHRKLHEWELLKIAEEIEQIKGERLVWNKERLGIDETAWNKVIHRGIKPVTVFAHPQVLVENPKRVRYYRMLAMVSQKSMSNVGLPIEGYENGSRPLKNLEAEKIARHLNKIISELIKMDDELNPREFDIWRGMAAGTQAQGSWQNEKGAQAALELANILIDRVKLTGVLQSISSPNKYLLKDGRVIIISSEPDIGFFDKTGRIIAAIEIKGGIDTAGTLERFGAAIKSLSRVKRENPSAITILVLPSVAMTKTFLKEVKESKAVDYYFAHDELINNDVKREELFKLLDI